MHINNYVWVSGCVCGVVVVVYMNRKWALTMINRTRNILMIIMSSDVQKPTGYGPDLVMH